MVTQLKLADKDQWQQFVDIWFGNDEHGRTNLTTTERQVAKTFKDHGYVKLSFGRKLQLARKEKAERDNGCSQQDVVNFLKQSIPNLEMTRQNYSDYENEKRKRPPHHNIVVMLAFFFNVPVSSLAEYHWQAPDEVPTRAGELKDLEFISAEDWALVKQMVDHMVQKQTTKFKKCNEQEL